MAGCATPGSTIASFDLIPSTLRAGATTGAVSPITKISGGPGTDMSVLTITLPALSIAAPSHRPSGDAITPAPHSTVAAGTRFPAATIPSASTLVTGVFVNT